MVANMQLIILPVLLHTCIGIATGHLQDTVVHKIDDFAFQLAHSTTRRLQPAMF